MIELLFFCLAAQAVDGDTLRCDNVPEASGRVRLARIDTPERGQPGFDEATSSLAALVRGREVTCRWADADPRTARIEWHDRFGRRVAFCSAAGIDLGTEQQARGYARPWP